MPLLWSEMTGKTMKAIVCTRYGPPEVLQLRDVEKPAPGKNEVCMRIFATAVTASDCIIRGFKVPLKLWLPMGLAVGFTRPRRPILGMVFAGEVESMGEDVESFKKGDQVFGLDRFTFGTYAEYKCMSEDGTLATKPTNLTYEEAAAIPYGGLLALHFLKKGNIQAGQRILVYGASGAIGTSAVQLAKSFGAEVTGVCSTPNLDLVKSLGADTVIDYTKDEFGNKDMRYDLVFDAVGKRKSSKLKLLSKKMLTPNGRYLSVDDGHPKLQVKELIFLKELAEARKIEPVIDRCYRLEQTAEAHWYVDSGHKKGNVAITVHDDGVGETMPEGRP